MQNLLISIILIFFTMRVKNSAIKLNALLVLLKCNLQKRFGVALQELLTSKLILISF